MRTGALAVDDELGVGNTGVGEKASSAAEDVRDVVDVADADAGHNIHKKA